MRGRWLPWSLVLALAAFVRLASLDRPPLSDTEARSAWWALGAARGESPPALAAPPDSALLLSSQALAFWIVDLPSAALARLPAAAAGIAAVGAAFLMGPWVGGSTGALVLGFLLAVEPGWVAASRRGDGAMLAAACALLALAALARIVRADDERSGCRITAFGAAGGALATAGPLAWDLLPVIAAALLAQPGALARRSAGRILRSAAAGAVLVATTGLAQWGATASVGESLGTWLQSWSSPRAEAAHGLPLTALPLAVLAVAGLLRDRGPQRLHRAFLVAAAVWGAVSLLRPAPLAGAWLVASLPLLIAAAGAVGHRLEGLNRLPTARRAPARLATASLAGLLLLPAARAGVSRAAGATTLSASELDLLAADLRALQGARREDGGVRRLEVVADPWPDPLLAWHLIDLPGVREVRSPTLAARGEQRFVLARVGGEAVLRGPDDRVLGRYRLDGGR